jgi:hypothetical protein
MAYTMISPEILESGLELLFLFLMISALPVEDAIAS